MVFHYPNGILATIMKRQNKKCKEKINQLILPIVGCVLKTRLIKVMIIIVITILL